MLGRRKLKSIRKYLCVVVCCIVIYYVIYSVRLISNRFGPQFYCGGNFIGYENKYAKLLSVVIDPSLAQGKVGGERIQDVLNQSEALEFYTLNHGYFQLNCSETIILYKFKENTYLRRWMLSLKTMDKLPQTSHAVKGWTIAIIRFEYANLYHTITDYYNTFRLIHSFNISPNNLTILFVDGHPHGQLDSTWTVLFGKVIRAGMLTKPTMFETLLWGISGYDSAVNEHNLNHLPLVEEFREFVFQRHHIKAEEKLNCERLNILVIFRRDYVAHPRNPSGKISRKIQNEDGMMDAIKVLLPGHNVIGSQIDLLEMDEQLKLISDTDILIGMHGAGLSHTLFLPQHAGLLELFPNYWYDVHFRAMARWRKLKYRFWHNFNGTRELPNFYTIVDEQRIAETVLEMKRDICS